jgi:hypothetical protein
MWTIFHDSESLKIETTAWAKGLPRYNKELLAARKAGIGQQSTTALSYPLTMPRPSTSGTTGQLI